MNWQPANTAPKNGTQFIAKVGYPWATITTWNEVDKKYVYTTLAASEMEDGNDIWFENEYAEESELEGWMPLPDISNIMSEREQSCLVFAARYAHGRNTGAALQVVESILSQWDRFDSKTQQQLIQEAGEAIYNKEDWDMIIKKGEDNE